MYVLTVLQWVKCFQMVEEKQSLEANLESVKAEADFSKGQLDLAKCKSVWNMLAGHGLGENWSEVGC